MDVRAVKNLKVAANVLVSYSLELNDKVHQFKSAEAVPCRAGATETKLEGTYSMYEFLADKPTLGQVLNKNVLTVRLMAVEGDRPLGEVMVPLKMLETGEQKRAMDRVVIVADKYLEVMQAGAVQGLVRVLLYLQDMGVATPAEKQASLRAAKKASAASLGGSGAPSGGQGPANPMEEQIVWQLEMWKRAEMAKFLAHLKQKEIEKIEEVTRDWKMKEAEREQAFNDSLQKVTSLESKVRQKATDLQRREERIIQLEEELKSKILEVSRQLTSKEEEILNIKKKFKEERVALEAEKKKLTKEVVDYQDKMQEASDRFFNLKKEVEDSPMSVLRQEIGTRQLEIIELESKVKSAVEQRDDYRAKYD